MTKFKQATGKVLITLILIYTTLWFIERWFFENILEKIIQKASENGIRISYVTSSASGFPDDLTFHLRSVNINFKNLIEMNSPGIHIKVGLLFPFKHHFQCNLEDITQGTFLKFFKFTAFQIHAKFFLKNMNFHDLEIAADSFITMHNQLPIIEMKPFQAHLSAVVEKDIPILHFLLHSSIKNWFGKSYHHIPMDIHTKLRILHYKTFLNSPYPFQAWHEKGGKIFIDQSRARGKQVDLQGTGMVSLSKYLFPQGDITLKIQGPLPFSYFIQNIFNLKNIQSSLLQFGLEGALKKDAEGYTVIPLNLENGNISFLGIPLIPLPSLQ